jgi:predicted RNA-binding protein with PIN domain
MKEYLIVDGYNMIGAWPELQRLKDVSLEEARDRLIGMLADYQGYSGMKVTVVFDAHYVPGRGGQYRQHRVEVLYTREKETADEVIERLVRNLKGLRRHVYVATSDMTEQHVTFGLGALRLPAGELLTKIRLARQELARRIEEERDRPGANRLDGRLAEDIREKLERWRRGGQP